MFPVVAFCVSNNLLHQPASQVASSREKHAGGQSDPGRWPSAIISDNFIKRAMFLEHSFVTLTTDRDSLIKVHHRSRQTCCFSIAVQFVAHTIEGCNAVRGTLDVFATCECAISKWQFVSLAVMRRTHAVGKAVRKKTNYKNQRKNPHAQPNAQWGIAAPCTSSTEPSTQSDCIS
eukprot:3382856-Amphidinium_carterae.1